VAAARGTACSTIAAAIPAGTTAAIATAAIPTAGTDAAITTAGTTLAATIPTTGTTTAVTATTIAAAGTATAATTTASPAAATAAFGEGVAGSEIGSSSRQGDKKGERRSGCQEHTGDGHWRASCDGFRLAKARRCCASDRMGCRADPTPYGIGTSAITHPAEELLCRERRSRKKNIPATSALSGAALPAARAA